MMPVKHAGAHSIKSARTCKEHAPQAADIDTRNMKLATTGMPAQYGAVSAVRSFAPIENPASRVLVLGSMPGAASLLAGRYYAYPHNAFWPIMGELFGAGPTVSYEKRVLILKRAGMSLWDVMASCVRDGSLDADIDEASIVPNDFRAFFDAHSQVKHVFFNGAKAEHCFHRTVRPHLADHGLHFTRLPSTSSAHASLSLAQKLKAIGVDTNRIRLLIITDSIDENLYLSSRNLPNVLVLEASQADPVSLIRFPNVLVTRNAVAKIEEMFA